ncbi:hypothetical protein TNCV_3015711 [Trichonephila clavipes]|nr:hypothetical protein TNCV_3015711 [Trichonephila clavipes]
MDVCKCIVPLWHGGTLTSHRATRLLVWKGKRGGRTLTLPQGVLLQNWGETELNRTVTCMVLRVTVDDRRTCSPLP